MSKYIMVIDEGTTGTRALIFDKKFRIRSQAYEEFTQYTPSEDKVEHDAMEIYDKTIKMCKQAIRDAQIKPEEILSIGITNQRATAIVWDKNTGEPLHNAIVWQDNRTSKRCEELNNSEWATKCKSKTGWTIAPVYSSLMLEWLINNIDEIKQKVESKDALFGTIDTWLMWKLTGGKTHAISYSNASVTGSLDLEKREWYTEFLDYLKVPVSIYPEIRDDSGDFGKTYKELFGCEIQIASSIADQHAALFGQGCTKEGMAKITNGTGSFLDVNIGDRCVVSEEGINTVIAWKIGDKINYALEGYASVTGSAVQWLVEELEIINKASEVETLAREVEDSNGVYFVPALAGLGAPYWDPFARGTILGITRGVNKRHICRATLEGIAYSIKDIISLIEEESGCKINEVKIDGGASKNNLLGQLFADYLNCDIYRPFSVEATSLGAAQMAGLYSGFWSEKDFENAIEYDTSFKNEIDDEKREELYYKWKEAIKRSENWANISKDNKELALETE